MNEGICSKPEHVDFKIQPRDGLAAFHDADFIERWITSERDLNQLLGARKGEYVDVASDDAEVLNELFGTDTLGGKNVIVTGRVQSGAEPFNIREAEKANRVMFRFGQIKFVRVTGSVPGSPRTEQLRAAIKLLPLPEFADMQAPTRYMLLEDAVAMECDKESIETLSTAELHLIFASIVKSAQELRGEESYQQLSATEQRHVVDQQAEEYSNRLTPLIQQRTPLMIDADEYQKYSTKKEQSPLIRKIDTRPMQMTERTGSMISGRLARISFSNAALSDHEKSPHMVVINDHIQQAYHVPLDTPFEIWTF